MDASSGGALEQAPRWDLMNIGSYGGGIRFLAPYLICRGYVGIYRRKEYVGGATGGPRGRGARLPPGRPPPRGPLVAQPTYFFLLYMFTYPENIQEHHETLFPPPQLSVPVRSHLGAFSGILPEGDAITEGFYINTIEENMP